MEGGPHSFHSMNVENRVFKRCVCPRHHSGRALYPATFKVLGLMWFSLWNAVKFPEFGQKGYLYFHLANKINRETDELASVIFFLILIYLLFIQHSACMCTCAPDLTTGGYEPTCACWELNSGPLGRTTSVLKPSLQPIVSVSL